MLHSTLKVLSLRMLALGIRVPMGQHARPVPTARFDAFAVQDSRALCVIARLVGLFIAIPFLQVDCIVLQFRQTRTFALVLLVTMVEHARLYQAVAIVASVVLASRALSVNFSPVGYSLTSSRINLVYFDIGTPNSAICNTNPCRNGATCQALQSGTFQCFCPAGFTGVLCEVSTGMLSVDAS